jgi:hypothetical protein
MSDINVQTFSGKVNISNNLKVGQGHLFVDTLNNQVGLNTNTPAAGLHVNGNTFVNTDLRVGTKVLIDSGATDSNVIEVTNGNIKAEFLHGDGSNITSISADNIDGTLSQWTGAVGSSIYYAENVGIGLTNPQFKLDVNGDANVGVLTATFLSGDGSNITNIVSSQWEGDPGNPIYYDGNVGIATSSAPTRTLEVGSNLYVEDAGSNVLVVDGSVAVDSISVGDFTIVASQGLDHVTNENNTTTQVVQFNHPTTGFITAANAVIGGTLSLQNFALSQSYGLENVTDVNNTTGDTIVSSNATTGFQSTANVSVGRDALVTGNVTVGKDLTVTEEATFSSNVTIAKDLEVSGNVTNLDILSNVNLLSVSNVVSIKKDSNVVTEFPRSKKLIKYPRVALTSASQDGYVVTASSEFGTTLWQSYYAFDNNTADGGNDNWASLAGKYTNSGQTYSGGSSLGNYDGEYIQIELPVKINLSLVRIFPRTNATPNPQTPKDFVIIASNDGVTYDLLKSVTNQSDSGTWINIDIHTTKLYNRFALVISKVISSDVAAIAELEYHGLPEYDPDAAGMDVKVTSYPNVPNTDWLEVYYDAKESSSYPGTGGTVVDLSGNGKNGTLNGGVGFDSEYKAFTFDGTDDYIESLNITSISGNQTMSSSVWVKFTSWNNATYDFIYSLGDRTVSGNGTEYTLSVDHQTNGLYIGTNGLAGSVQFRFIPDLERWYHFATTYDGDTNRIFIDGTLRNSESLIGDLNLPTSGCDLVLGGDTASSRGQFMNGSIANFRLFNRALTSDEVWQLYAYQKEYFGHGDLSMTLKAGRLGIGTSEPRVALDVRGDVHISGNLRKTRARMIGLESGSKSFSQDGWQTYVSYGEEWTAYSSNPLYSISITGDWVDDSSRAVNYRLVVKNQRTGEVVYFPSSSGWTKHLYETHSRLDGHGYLGIMSGLIPGDSYKVQLEVDPNSTSNYKWNSIYGTITGLVWD